MPDVTPIRWDPKRLSSSVYAAAFERSGVSDGRINRRLPVISLLLLCTGRVIAQDWAKFCRNRIDPMGRWRGWLAAYRAGDFVERHCHLRGDGDGCAVRRRVFITGRLAGVSVNHYGVALVAICWQSASDGKASKANRCRFARALGRVWLYGTGAGTGFRQFGVIATFITLLL